MLWKFNFTTNEIQEISEFLKQKDFLRKFPLSLRGLLNEWLLFVNKCEQGYDNCLAEYLNDLSCRETIQELIDQSSSNNVKEQIRNNIDNPDRKFLEITQPISISLSHNDSSSNLREMLYSRIPKKLIGELKNDIELQYREFFGETN